MYHIIILIAWTPKRSGTKNGLHILRHVTLSHGKVNTVYIAIFPSYFFSFTRCPSKTLECHHLRFDLLVHDVITLPFLIVHLILYYNHIRISTMQIKVLLLLHTVMYLYLNFWYVHNSIIVRYFSTQMQLDKILMIKIWKNTQCRKINFISKFVEFKLVTTCLILSLYRTY